jgi:hypothetical protein
MGKDLKKSMKIVLSEHAKKQMLERNLIESEIISTILKPDKIIPQSHGKSQAVKSIKKNRKQYLMVVIYRKTNSSLKVITAFLTSKIKKYLK